MSEEKSAERRWDDYRFNGLRTAIKDAREPWTRILPLAQQQLRELEAGQAQGRIDAYDSALRLLDTWVLAIQEGEASE